MVTKYVLRNKPKYIIIHHSLSPDKSTRDWEGLRKYHLEKGWLDIGYHYGFEKIDKSYMIRTGRPQNVEAAHALGFNNKSIGICIVGNFDLETPIKKGFLFSLGCFVRELQRKYQIKAKNVLAHRETYLILEKENRFDILKRLEWKSCCGKLFSMTKFRARLIQNNPHQNSFSEQGLLNALFYDKELEARNKIIENKGVNI